MRLSPSATNYSSTGRQKIPTGRHFCRPVTTLKEAMTVTDGGVTQLGPGAVPATNTLSLL